MQAGTALKGFFWAANSHPAPSRRCRAIAAAGAWTLALLVATGATAVEAQEKTAPPTQEHPRAVRERPDVVLISFDTTRIDRLSIYGAERPTSPELRKFAQHAVIYDRAYATSSWTLPSHCSMFTGRMPLEHGAHNHPSGEANLGQLLDGKNLMGLRTSPLGEQQLTLAELLSSKGYATGAFVGGPWLVPRFGAMQGFRETGGSINKLGGRPANEVTDEALAWVETVAEEEPIFLFLNYFDPHWPYQPPAGFTHFARGNTQASDWDLYDGEIRFMDTHFGRLLRELRALNRYENTLIIVVGDHGQLFDEHGVTGHSHWLYEPLVRVPLVVRQPKAHGMRGRSHELVSVMDLPAIVAKTLNFDLPPQFESVSPGKRREVFSEVYQTEYLPEDQGGEDLERDLFTVLRPPWKLILDSRGKTQLYNVYEDASESVDHAPERTLPTEALTRIIERWRDETIAPERVRASADSETILQLQQLGYLD